MKQLFSFLFAWIIMTFSEEESIQKIYNGLLPWQKERCMTYQVTTSCCGNIKYKIRYPEYESDVKRK